MTSAVRRLSVCLTILFSFSLSACSTDRPAASGVATSIPTAAPISAPLSPTSVPAVQTPILQATLPTALPTPTFDPHTCPLTGLPVEDLDWSQRRAILVQLGNSPPERPQSELALADLVFEHLTEGGITRFSAVYLCQTALNIGPVRSGRLVNLENVPMLNAIFVHVGASNGVLARFNASEINQAKFDEYVGDPGITRITTRQPPFNAYTSTELIWSLARERGWASGDRVTVLPFDARLPSDGGPATRIDLPIRPGVTDVAYAYDAASGVYLRSMAGFPHTDLATGEQLRAANVLVIYAAHTETDIIEDSLGSRSIQIDLTSGGRAQLLRDGQVYEGRWSRPDPHAFFELTDAAGDPLNLKPGVTWIQIVPMDFAVTIG
ncbi:MAG TPA: DUF3048 domain-containing protein [Anaerolineae bacterium]|nr:DUF3048 domain-containing protein [Anaerolineae bacterium]